MKNTSNINSIIRYSLAFGLAQFIWAPLQAETPAPAKQKTVMENKSTEPVHAMTVSDKHATHSQQAMMQQHQAMIADMKAQDAELATRITEMNKAPADKKLTLMAGIITSMAEQRAAMNTRMSEMQEQMMKSSNALQPVDVDTYSKVPKTKELGINDK
jgi:hypothetical protein